MDHNKLLQNMSIDDLHKKAEEAGITGHSNMSKDQLIDALKSKGGDFLNRF